MICCICETRIRPSNNGWDQGHNASPIVEGGRCCTACNHAKVIPARFDRLASIQEVDEVKRAI